MEGVLIPGIWNEASLNQLKVDYSWAQDLTATAIGDARIFIFRYRLEVDGSSLWNQLLGQAAVLVRRLDQSRVEAGTELRPILFICHSLGGIVLKKALSLAIRSQLAYEDVSAGLILLGCPHLKIPQTEDWVNVKLVMKANRKDISKNNMTEDEIESIANTCRQFEELHLSIPILTVAETRETKLRDHFWSALRPKSKPAILLMPTSIVSTNSMHESIFLIHKTHDELCRVSRTEPFYARLTRFFTDFAQYAPKRVELAFRQIPVSDFERFNVRTRSSVSSFRDIVTPETSSKFTPTSGESQESIALITPQALREQPALAAAAAPPPPPPNLSDDVAEQILNHVQLPFAHISSIARNDNFFGRDDVIRDIDAAFDLDGRTAEAAPVPEESSGGPKTYALCGMGGIGKTEIAIEYLYSRLDRFDVLIWVYADTVDKLRAQFIALAEEVAPKQASGGLDEVSAREMVKGWLAAPIGYRSVDGKLEPKEANWLMVFDNADDPDILYDWLPTQGPGCILVTGRYPYTRENIYRLGAGHDMEPFLATEGGKMLRLQSKREHETKSLETSVRIAELLGGLPLAITQMSAIIQRKHLSLQDFEEWYREDARKLHDLRIEGAQPNYRHTVGTTWAVGQLSGAALALMKVISVLDPDRIQEELLTDGAQEVKLHNYPKRKHIYFEARAELIKAALVRRNMATDELRVHRLVQEVVRYIMDEEEFRSVKVDVAALISTVWPYVSGTDPTRNQYWRIPIAERYTPHIALLEKFTVSDVMKGKHSTDPILGYLYCSYAWYAYERGSSSQTEHFASLALQVLQPCADGKTGDQERITFWLGEAHHNLSLASVVKGSSDGMQDVELWLKILLDRVQRFNLPEEALSLATAYNQLGICHMSRKEVDQALENWQRSLDAYINAPNRPMYSGVYPALSLAQVYTIQGKAQEAERVLKPIREEYERIVDIEDTTLNACGLIWRSMGNIRNLQKRYSEALVYHQRALTNMRATLGEKHDFTGDCHYSLAVDWSNQGNWQQAMESIDAALEAFTAADNREAQAARAFWRKGVLLRDAGDHEQSEVCFVQAMTLRRKVLPTDDRLLEHLSEADWSEAIIYWSR